MVDLSSLFTLPGFPVFGVLDSLGFVVLSLTVTEYDATDLLLSWEIAVIVVTPSCFAFMLPFSSIETIFGFELVQL